MQTQEDNNLINNIQIGSIIYLKEETQLKEEVHSYRVVNYKNTHTKGVKILEASVYDESNNYRIDNLEVYNYDTKEINPKVVDITLNPLVLEYEQKLHALIKEVVELKQENKLYKFQIKALRYSVDILECKLDEIL